MGNRELLSRAERALGQAVYELTWAGLLWGKFGAIRLSRFRAEFLVALGEGVSAETALLSTYYTAVGNAAAQFQRSARRFSFSALLWAVRAVWCLLQVMRRADRLRRGGIDRLTPDQLDVLGSALERMGRRSAALRCINAGLDRLECPPNTTALLLIKKAAILDHRGRRGDAADALVVAQGMADRGKVPPTTAVRIYRALAEFWLRHDDESQAEAFFSQAEGIAEKYDLGDQKIKINAARLRERHGG